MCRGGGHRSGPGTGHAQGGPQHTQTRGQSAQKTRPHTPQRQGKAQDKGRERRPVKKKIKVRTQPYIQMCYYDSMEHRDEGQRTLPHRPRTLLSYKAFSVGMNRRRVPYFMHFYCCSCTKIKRYYCWKCTKTGRGRSGFYPGVTQKFFRISLRKGRKETGDDKLFYQN